MKVKDCMCGNVCYCTPETTIGEIAKMMCDNHVGCIPVCNNEKNVVGILTDRDIILRHTACNKDSNNTKASEIMTCNTTCCDCNTTVDEAINKMAKSSVRRIPVTENGKLVGILTLGDIAKNDQIENNLVGQTIECICKHNDKNAE